MDMQSAPTSTRKPRNWEGSMRFGVFWPYSRTMTPSGLISEMNPDFLDLENHIRLAKRAEAVGLDFLLIADGYAPSSDAATAIGFQDPRYNAVLGAVPLLRETQRIGVVSTIHTTYFHPVHVARFASHLDWIGGGRWGWNIVNGFRDKEALLFGFDETPDHDATYDMADEYLDVVSALWTGKEIEHHGATFTVRGKLSGPYPNERPLLVNAASSARGRSFAATHCDYLFASVGDFSQLPAIAQDLAAKAREAGRAPGTPQMLTPVTILLRDRPGEASDEFARLMASHDPEANQVWLKTLSRLAQDNRPMTGLSLVGTPQEVADQIAQLREQFGLNGVLFRLLLWDAAEAERIAPLLDRLQTLGVWRPPAERQFSW